MYNHKEIEKKWQNYWEENKTFKVENGFSKPKYYTLDMFPFPSGAGLHVGHPEGMTANDIVARYKTACGFNVLHPMGWDAFGLPAENYAIKTGTHPSITTKENINTFRKQIKALGFSYDWDREVDTTDPKYYKWTQTIFLKLFEKGLAYEQDLPINYCPSCKTGLANEEVLNDFTCERCGTKVEKKKIRQWVLAITKYADRLLKDVDKLDWPEGIKEMQRNWIGKSEGCEFNMKVVENKTQKKGRLPLPINWGGLNVLAKPSSTNSIFENMLFVNKKVKKINLLEIKEKIQSNLGIVNFNGNNVYIHFKNKNRKEVLIRKSISGAVFNNISNINFSNNIGYFIYKKQVIKIILGKQSNGNYYVKTFFIDDRVSKIYREYFKKEQNTPFISVYTTRIDTVFGMTYAVLAPDHKDIMDFITPEQKEACLKYIEDSAKKSDQDRTQDDKEKTGVFTGSFVTNPFNGKEVPLWIGDYVLGNYGTGAVMAVPAHDTRDFAFAKKYDLEIINSIEPSKGTIKSGLGYGNLGNNKILPSTPNHNEENTPNRYLYSLFLENKITFLGIDGLLINSGNFTGLTSQEAQTKLIEYAEKEGFGTKKINYKLRDWLFSRQRYWGEPIPLIHLNMKELKNIPHINNISEATNNNLAYILKREPINGESSCDNTTCGGKVRELIIGGKVFSKIYDGIYGKTICDYNLPLKLPEVKNFEPSGDGQSPLANVDSFVNIELAENLSGKRETNTMPQWGGSCWYYLRYMDPHNENMLVDPEIEKYWGQVDSYVGGAEHAVLHLLYARFWHKFLFDIGVVSSDEPFYRLRNQGLILAHAFQRKNGGLLANDLVEEKSGKYYEIETGEEVDKIISKMSKSLKNVVNPDDIIEQYGADSLRLYEMYMAEFKDAAPWDTKGIIGVRRFIEKSERLFLAEAKISTQDDNFTMKLLHKTIKKVQEDIENYKFNTAIASLMILVNNGLPKDSELQSEWKKTFVIILNPFTPHLAEELSERLGSTESISKTPWPKYDSSMIIDNTIKIAVQVLGKVRGTIEINKDEGKNSVLKKAKTNEDVAKWLEGKDLVKEIYVPGKIVNLVVK